MQSTIPIPVYFVYYDSFVELLGRQKVSAVGPDGLSCSAWARGWRVFHSTLCAILEALLQGRRLPPKFNFSLG
eukprot:2597841-Pyramimonas_sp.AAC.1